MAENMPVAPPCRNNLVVSGDREQLAQVRFGFLRNADEGLAAMADFHDRHAAAAPVDHFCLSLLENFQGQCGRPWGEIEYAHEINL